MLSVFLSLAAAAVLLGADQLVKWWARAYLSGSDPIPVIGGVLELVYVENRGAAWGMFQGKRWLLLGITAVVLIVLLCYLVLGKASHPVEYAAISLIISGGAGNLIDRLLFGFVTDYIYFKPIDFPVFNLADVCVVTGTVLFCVYWVFVEARLRGKKGGESFPGKSPEEGKDDGTEH